MNIITQNPKDWWAPVWIGLVSDRDGKHYRRIKSAIWLFLYLLLNADRRSGFLRRKIRTICSEMGTNKDTVLRWLNVLRGYDYVVTENTGRCLSIQIQKWKTLSKVGNMQPQICEISNPRGRKNPTSQEGLDGRNFSHLSQILEHAVDPNDIPFKKSILKNDNVIYKSSLKRFAYKRFSPGDTEDLLALKICKAFKDKENLPLYLAYVKKYPPEIIQRAFEEANKIPTNKIRKTRGALFTYLVKYYAHD